jgi:hypothetical protein
MSSSPGEAVSIAQKLNMIGRAKCKIVCFGERIIGIMATNPKTVLRLSLDEYEFGDKLSNKKKDSRDLRICRISKQ